jgi:hypothetical protein
VKSRELSRLRHDTSPTPRSSLPRREIGDRMGRGRKEYPRRCSSAASVTPSELGLQLASCIVCSEGVSWTCNFPRYAGEKGLLARWNLRVVCVVYLALTSGRVGGQKTRPRCSRPSGSGSTLGLTFSFSFSHFVPRWPDGCRYGSGSPPSSANAACHMAVMVWP